MANNSISATKIIGLALLVAGVGLAYWGITYPLMLVQEFPRRLPDQPLTR